VVDRINVDVVANDLVKEAIEKHGDYIKVETLTDSINIVEKLDTEEIELNENVSTRLKVEKS